MNSTTTVTSQRPPLRVLFLCTHNAARSILAEALFNHLARDRGLPARAESAGSRPSGRVHPMALAVLDEAGIPSAGLASKGWEPFLAEQPPDLLITVCDDAAGEACPLFLSVDHAPEHRHWPLSDPSARGTREAFRDTLGCLTERIEALIAELTVRLQSGSSPGLR